MRPIVLLFAVALAACSSTPPAASVATDLHVQNSTTVMITIVVNGGPGVRVAPGIQASDFAGLPALPWTVEARAESGRTLATMFVGKLQDPMPVEVDRGVDVIGSSAAFPLTCGSIVMWVGHAPGTDGAPTPASSLVPDCGS